MANLRAVTIVLLVKGEVTFALSYKIQIIAYRNNIIQKGIGLVCEKEENDTTTERGKKKKKEIETYRQFWDDFLWTNDR